jgi:activator of 2-hydroxyglutaryl-CoA dehydratase
MGRESLASTEEIFISNTCTVFAESEVITHVARGIQRPDIIAGIHRSIVNRLLSMMRRKKIRPDVCLTGGVAKNVGIVRLVERELGLPVRIHNEPQITGALGAALLARQRIR